MTPETEKKALDFLEQLVGKIGSTAADGFNAASGYVVAEAVTTSLAFGVVALLCLVLFLVIEKRTRGWEDDAAVGRGMTLAALTLVGAITLGFAITGIAPALAPEGYVIMKLAGQTR